MLLAARYPQWEAFRALLREHDPKGVFRNDFLTRYLGSTEFELTPEEIRRRTPEPGQQALRDHGSRRYEASPFWRNFSS